MPDRPDSLNGRVTALEASIEVTLDALKLQNCVNRSVARQLDVTMIVFAVVLCVVAILSALR